MTQEELKTLTLSRIQKSKLTEEQIEHFKKGGVFSATFKPTKDDIKGSLRTRIGKRVSIYCNHETVPCLDVLEYLGQYKFFIEGYEEDGWCPECDFIDIEPQASFMDVHIWNCDHQYLMAILDKDELERATGKGTAEKFGVPFIIGRVYSSKAHDMVRRFANFDIILYKFKNQNWEVI